MKYKKISDFLHEVQVAADTIVVTFGYNHPFFTLTTVIENDLKMIANQHSDRLVFQ